MTDDEILAATGFADAPGQMKATMVANVRSVAEMRLMRTVDDRMSRKQRKEFDRLVAAGDDAAVWRWIGSAVLDTSVEDARDAATREYVEELARKQHEMLGHLGNG